MKRSDIRPSFCPIDRQQQRRPVGLLLSALWAECLQCFDAVGWAAGRASGL